MTPWQSFRLNIPAKVTRRVVSALVDGADISPLRNWVRSLDIRYDWMHASLTRIQRDDNTTSSKFRRYLGPRLETISRDRYNTKLTALQRKGNGDVRESVFTCALASATTNARVYTPYIYMCVCVYIYIYIYIYTYDCCTCVCARAAGVRDAPCVCGLRRLTIRDAGIYGRWCSCRL